MEIVNTAGGADIKDAHAQGKFRPVKMIASLNQFIKPSLLMFSENYDAVYVSPGQTFLGFLRFAPIIVAADWTRSPIYLHFHGGYFRKMVDSLGMIRKGLVLNVLRRATGVIVEGWSLRSLVSGLCNEGRIHHCENGIDDAYVLTDLEIQAKARRRENGEPIRILYLSNLVKSKGILDLLEALRILKSRGFAFRCDVAGAIETGFEPEVEPMLSDLQDVVRYHGTVSGIPKRDLLKSSDVLCLPTYYEIEGQPVSILEAYGAGCAVVCTNHSGIKDIFEDGRTGFYCDKMAPASVADALEKAAALPTTVVTDNHRLVSERYSEAKFIERLESIFMRRSQAINP